MHTLLQVHNVRKNLLSNSLFIRENKNKRKRGAHMCWIVT
uniref:Uncharacterized protein n=1 Tax=Arundo donax TaxID=35708 RepID=A0A0A9BKY9_ARUDO